MIQYKDVFEFLKATKEGRRFQYLTDLIDANFKDNYTIDPFSTYDKSFKNIYLPGTSNNFIIAHHDVVNPLYCANDNSASVINCLIFKQNHPEINVAIVDGEEPPVLGKGSQRLSELINKGQFGTIHNVFNFELTGVGRNIMISPHRNQTSSIIKSKVKYNEINTPFSDSDILIRNGINSECMTLLPNTKTGEIDMSYIYYCHSPKDNESILNIDDMKWFVEEQMSLFVL